MERKKKVLVMGVIGADVHAVGNRTRLLQKPGLTSSTWA